MQALRKIVTVENHSLSIVLPDDFSSTKVEVIILPYESIPEKRGASNLRGKLNLSDEQYNDFQKSIVDSRNEWSRDI